MTYGWALLLIALVAAAVFSLGILDVGSFLGSRAVGFSQITPVGWQMGTDGALQVKLKNGAGTDINITSMNATQNGQVASFSQVIPIAEGEESSVLAFSSFPLPLQGGTSYTISINIAYMDSESEFEYLDSGTLTGKVT